MIEISDARANTARLVRLTRLFSDATTKAIDEFLAANSEPIVNIASGGVFIIKRN